MVTSSTEKQANTATDSTFISRCRWTAARPNTLLTSSSTPGLQGRMLDYAALEQPPQTIIAGNRVLKERYKPRKTAAGLIFGDRGACSGMQPVFFARLRVQHGDGHHLRLRATAAGNDRRHPSDEATREGRWVLYSLSLELDDVHMNATLRAEPADLWHRRLRHINRKSPDVLWKWRATASTTTETSRCAMSALSREAHNMLIRKRQMAA